MRGVRSSGGRLIGLTGRSMRLAWRADRTLLLASGLLQLLNAILLAAQIFVIRAVLVAIIGAQNNGGSITRAVWPVTALVVITAVTTAISAVQTQWQRLLAELVGRESWQTILDVTSGVELEVYDSPEFYDHLQRVQANAITRPFILSQAIVGLFGSSLSTVGLAFAVVSIEPVLLPLMLLAAVPLYLGIRYGGRLEFRFATEQSARLRLRQYLIAVQTGRNEAKEVRAFALATALRGRFTTVYEHFVRDLRQHVARRTVVALASSLASAAALAATLFVLVYLVARGSVSVAAAGAGVVAVRMLAAQITAAFSGMGQIVESGLFLDDLTAFVTSYRQSADREDTGLPAPDSFEQIDVEHLEFRYAASTRRALDGVDLHIRRGEVVALVGENGSGKTTLAKILAGLYVPTSGRICWDGVDLRSFRRRALRRSVAVIFQDFIRYQLSARDNIEFGRNEWAGDSGRLDRAAQVSGVAPIIGGLPRAYDTVLSTAFDGGRDLSGGQWQRVALARAFYRDASFVILDEPSAALDPRAEYELFRSLRTLLAGRTVLFVSHRMSSVRDADRIHFMAEGRIVESGTHEELIRLNGRYAELFALQAAGFTAASASGERP